MPTTSLRQKSHRSDWLCPPSPDTYSQDAKKQKGHCTNVSEPNHPHEILSDVIGLRNLLKKILSGINLSNFRVLDSCCVTDCEITSNIERRLNSLKKVTSADSVHYLANGYSNLVKSCMVALTAAKCRGAEQAQRSPSLHFWRGFHSPVGAECYVNQKSVHGNFRGGSSWGTSRGRGGHVGRLFHPYRRN